MMLKTWLVIIGILIFSRISAQEFTPEVKSFISIDTSFVAITNVTIIDGTGRDIQLNQTLIISNGLIQDVGDANSVKTPKNAMIIDGEGKTLIPGLVMLHEHLFYPTYFENWYDVVQMTYTFPRLYLAGGVTTMRTAGSIQPQTDLNIKKLIIEGKMTGPKIDVTGPYIDREGLGIPALGYILNADEVSAIVNYWADKGVTSFKVYNYITKEDLHLCVAEAHKRGLKVTGHLCSLTYEEASNIGIDNLEHGFRYASDFIDEKEEAVCYPRQTRQSLRQISVDDPRMENLINILIKNNTALTTTPAVFEPYTDREIVHGGGFDALTPHLQIRVKNIYDSMVNNDSLLIIMSNKNSRWLKRFYEKGGLLVAGSDPTGSGRTIAGYANQRTVEILVEEGFLVQDAIKICTLNGALFLEKQTEIGTIEKDKIADLVLINGDLNRNIKNIRNMEIVFKDGVGFDSKKLFESVRGKVGLN